MYESENTFEFDPEMSSFESEQYESEQFENEQFEQFEFEEAEWGEVFNESEVMELTAELMEVTNEEELDLFLGKLIKKAGSAIKKVVKSPIGRAVGGVLKGVAKKALPIAGGALGTYFGGPLGAKIGSGLASAAGKALGLELEALSQEDREFEGGKQFVRFAANTVKNAVSAPASTDPRRAAQAAAAKAARKFAPALLGAGTSTSASMGKGRSSGRWIRRGRNIIILNA
ncbi:hypothetical protein C8R30_11130 [Nitrosomonas nitrosa]|jgi:hypothetical protein|uniref:hypothetical protein n=1 Tax=Nitrosomonas nitrosa TaxID=52442 RepID=UPI000D4B3FE8|nr:hypothetical protein [Nitrosomonas nitrosa]MCO6434831.1 hypothetical protein [Nitrosomonas nitrosa]PTQ97451.1 hypothetical protein C8R30_11130 [Nitrosomonas nitrosa]